MVSRCFGILPVLGVWPTGYVKCVHFKWITLPILVTIVLLGFATMDLFLNLNAITQFGMSLATTGPMSFSLETVMSLIVFLILSRNWPNLMRATYQVELIFFKKRYSSPESRTLSRQIRYIGVIFLIGSIVEHLSYVSSSLYGNHLQIKQCNLSVDFWENYYARERLQIFSVFEYNVWLIPLLQWVTISLTFGWNFVDIFLILVCRGLAMRFKQFHWRLQKHQKLNMKSDFWLEMRNDFLTLTDLLCQYDDKLSNLVLLSSAQNMFFLAVQIFHSFQARDNFMQELYYWNSLLFVSIRIFFMMYSAAIINDTATEILSAIYEIPTSDWCLELKRLNEVIITDTIALSGKGFFFLTKRLILAMAGTLVVYELVLLDQVDGGADVTPLCKQKQSY